MKLLSKILSAAVLTLTVACGASASYRLPVPAVKATEMFAPIAAAAQEKGMQASELKDSVNVEVGEDTWVYYRVFQNSFDMVVHITNDELPEAEAQARLKAGKQKGDEVWKRAMELRSEFEHGTKS